MTYNELFRTSSIISIVDDIQKGILELSDPFRVATNNFNLLNDIYHPFCSSLSYESSLEVREKSFPAKFLPLNGIPFGIKDIFNTQVMPTTMGSPIWSGFVAGNNARCVDSFSGKVRFRLVRPLLQNSLYMPECHTQSLRRL